MIASGGALIESIVMLARLMAAEDAPRGVNRPVQLGSFDRPQPAFALKSTLVTFVHNGGKLIIYDSECPSQDYSWLPFPFTTANPGPEGQTGQMTIIARRAGLPSGLDP